MVSNYDETESAKKAGDCMSEVWEPYGCIDFDAPNVWGLSDEDQNQLNELVEVWKRKLVRNRNKKTYYELAVARVFG